MYKVFINPCDNMKYYVACPLRAPSARSDLKCILSVRRNGVRRTSRLGRIEAGGQPKHKTECARPYRTGCSCEFKIHVEDNEPPQFASCPEDRVTTTDVGKPYWPAHRRLFPGVRPSARHDRQHSRPRRPCRDTSRSSRGSADRADRPCPP